MRSRLLMLFGLVMCLVVLAGCGVLGYVKPTESDRGLNDQNKKAGILTAAKSDDPEIKQAGLDVAANSETLEKNLIGPPANPQNYAPTVSAALRKKSTEDHSTPWWQDLLKGALGALVGGGLVFKFLGPLGGVAQTLVEGMTRVREDIRSRPEGQRHASEADLLGIMGKVQETAGPKIKGLIGKLAHKIEAKLAARL